MSRHLPVTVAAHPQRVMRRFVDDEGKMGERSMKHASNMLVVLLYAQGLLGFAGLASVVVKDWAHSEPIFVHGVAPAAR